MAFRYINPGYVSLLDSDCTAIELIDSTYSRTGVAFRQTGYRKGITISEFAQGDEFWAKFNWYLPPEEGYYHVYCSAPATYRYGLYIVLQLRWGMYQIGSVMAGYPSGNTSNDFAATLEDSGLKLGTINRILFHLVFGDAATAYMECTINNIKLPRSTGRSIPYNAKNNGKVAELYSTDGATAISNVILSDQEISIREDVVALPITATDTDMTAGENGLYIADAANQSLLQSVDAATLGAIHGINSPVTGVALVGNPAYKTTKGEASLTSLSKSGGIVTEHDSFSLSDDTESVIQSCRTLSNTTIADLQKMQFGWKAGA
ncbi:MAG: hypothetical protein IKI76_09320 [Selenomonadaceae bacterium]|nr:hypothetical protein [Selenomonadaceae bacterium]